VNESTWSTSTPFLDMAYRPRGVAYELEVVPADGAPFPVYWVKTSNSGPAPAPHVRSVCGTQYKLLVRNNSDARIAAKIRVDGRSVLPEGGCFVVRPGREREMQGFQLARTFSGGSFTDEWAAFVFGRPSLVEPGQKKGADGAPVANKEIGCLVMEVYEAVEMQCPQSNLTSSTAAAPREGVSAEKKDSVFSSLTLPGQKTVVAARPVQRWYRDGQLLQTVKLFYKEEHALIFNGVPPTEFGHAVAQVRQRATVDGPCFLPRAISSAVWQCLRPYDLTGVSRAHRNRWPHRPGPAARRSASRSERPPRTAYLVYPAVQNRAAALGCAQLGNPPRSSHGCAPCAQAPQVDYIEHCDLTDDLDDEHSEEVG
jgi:hypothetical protein